MTISDMILSRFRRGEDTHVIAEMLHIKESLVYAMLHEAQDRHRLTVAGAARRG